MNKLPERIRIKDIARLAVYQSAQWTVYCMAAQEYPKPAGNGWKRMLKQLDYQPNMYAALASNKKYLFVCLLPQHKEGDYWTDVEMEIKEP